MSSLYLVLLLFARFYICYTQTNSQLTSSATFTSSISIDITINSNTVNLTMRGPTDQWFGVGFGSTQMANTYAIISSGGRQFGPPIVYEITLGNHTHGNKISSQMISVHSNINHGSLNTRTIQLSRSRIGDSNHYTFPNQSTTIPVIWAYGPDENFCCTTDQPGGTTMSGGGSTNLTFTTDMTTTTTVPATTQLTAGMVLSPADNFDILVNIENNLVTITMNGPLVWYGVGFGSNAMQDTYSIIVGENIEERILGYHNSGSIISSSMTVQNDTTDTTNSIRTVVLTRDRIGDATHYSFPSSAGNIQIIYSYGNSSMFNSMGFSGTGTLSFMEDGASNAPTLNPTEMLPTKTQTPAPTNAITPSPTQTTGDCDVFASKNIVSAYGIAIVACIDLTTDMIDIIMSGPVDIWFSIGFGNTIMKNTYAIVAADSVEEYKLGDDTEGSKLSAFINKINDTVVGGTRHVHVSRALTSDDGDYFSFPTNTEIIDIIFGTGSQLTYAGSNMGEEDGMGVETLTFIANGDTLSPTSEPTIMSTGDNNCADILTATQNVGDGFDLDIGFSIDCKEKTITLSVIYEDFSPNWLGIVFGNSMRPDDGEYYTALVFTTGKLNDRIKQFYTYYITGKTIDSVLWQSELNWTQMNQEINGNQLLVEYETSLSNTQWSISTTTITFRYAYGSDLTLTKHISTSDIFTYNMQTGDVIISKDDISPYTAHGIIMWIAWSLLTSVGIMSSRFRIIIERCAPQRKALWFLIHRAIQITVVIFVIISFSICVYYTGHNGNGHFNSSHKKLGLAIFIIGICQPLNALIRPHPTVNGKSKPVKRFIWEIVHKGLGYSLWIMALINCYLGLKTDIINSQKWTIIHCVWIVIIVIVFVCLWIYHYWLIGKQNESGDTIGVGLLDNDVVKLKRKTHKASLSNSVELRRNSDSNDKQILNNETGNTQYQLLENEQL